MSRDVGIMNERCKKSPYKGDKHEWTVQAEFSATSGNGHIVVRRCKFCAMLVQAFEITTADAVSGHRTETFALDDLR